MYISVHLQVLLLLSVVLLCTEVETYLSCTLFERRKRTAAAEKKIYRGLTHSENALHTCGAFTECVTPFNGLKGV